MGAATAMVQLDDKERLRPEMQQQQVGHDDAISRSLKRTYNDVVQEPLPDRLVELLSKLKGEEKG